MNKKRVVLRGPVLSASGYGVHARQIARWLLSRQDVDLIIQTVQWGITPWYIDKNACDGLIGKILERSKDDKGPFDVSFQVQLPNEWQQGLAKKDIGVTAGIETTVCNPEWVQCINSMHTVVVPSTFSRAVFERTSGYAMKNITVIPESFIDVVADDVEPLNIELSTKFNFLMIGQMTSRNSESDRKNLFNAIKWFCETFADDKDVGLIIKTNNGRETKIDRKVTSDIIKTTIAQVRKSDYPRVHLLHGSMSDVEMAGLYKHPSVKAFVSLTRGEGFGLPLLEAAASGVPVIATNWSGHLDFLKLGKFIKVDYELKQINKSRVDGKIFVDDAKWADVVETDVKRKLLKFREHPETPTEWANELKEKIRHDFSYSAVSRMYDVLWDQLG